MLEVLAAPLVACLILTGIHCYLGIHVLMREVIFVDLALAQIAALGAAIGMLIGFAPGTLGVYLTSLAFTFFGAAIFAIGRFRGRLVPQEAVIGIAYAVSSAVAILILSKTAIERDQIENMLVGRLLYITWPEIGETIVIYGLIALLHVVWRRRFFQISSSTAEEFDAIPSLKLWDFLFYATFGVVVTSSVKMAGVLLVFSFLIVPASCAMLFFKPVRSRLLAGWGFGVLASAAGLAASAAWDLPTGASVVGAFGALFLLCSLTHVALSHRQAGA